MCIEYVGAIVGHKVADKREADYDRRGTERVVLHLPGSSRERIQSERSTRCR